MSIVRIYAAEGAPVSEQPIEMVERKGIGHPDTICDGIMEHISVALSGEYRRHFGRILHHNVDKGLLVAGRAERRFGGGRVLEPMRLIVGDRASIGTPSEHLDVSGIAIEAAKGWMRKHLPNVDPDAHVRYQVELRPGSEALVGLFDQERNASEVLGANDTSVGVGYAPLTETERLVLETERYLNGAQFKKLFPATGQDAKVMGLRIEGSLDLTVAIPLLDRCITRESEYFEIREACRRELLEWLQRRLKTLERVGVELNALDRPGRGLAGMYLSVTGTSAEDADSGQVGRGNRLNGLIPHNRPQSSEATAGKNPVSHVGKIYNVLAHRVAADIYNEVAGLNEVTLWLLSRIGEPVDRPQAVAVRVHLKDGVGLPEVRELIQERIEGALAEIPSLCLALAEGRYTLE
jgi:S-adenosylmethionine synthetase